ncbi:MAG TPA: ATP-binding cassette domain-containing protein [Candidatus Cloacimonetes bacterium]|nr:ATP-binding cassette domain-containing protein [Candidatus Cloacimonadota bacterium]
MNNIIEVKDLITEYDGLKILDGISIDVKENEVFIILGGSGCGKTTLLKHIIGLLQPVSGSIKIFGEETTTMEEEDFEEILIKCGVLFQNGALLNSLSIGENVAIPIEQHTDFEQPLIDRMIKTKLHLVELGQAMNLSPAELSGGMRKRAALARAIALDPQILFCDEPSAGLDPVTSAAIDSLLLKLKEQLNMTIVVVTHELASIHRIADRIVFLDKGKALFVGTLQEALDCDIKEIKEFFSVGRF